MPRYLSNIKSSLLDNKTLKQTIFKNVFWITLSEFFNKVFTYIIVIWIARHFGPTVYGQFAFALSFVGLFVILCDLGFNTITIREIARNKLKAPKYIDNILLMKIVLGFITFGVIVFATIISGKDTSVRMLIYALGIYNIVNSFNFFFHSVFQSNEKMQYETVCRIFQQFVLMCLVTFFILNNSPIIFIGYAYIISVILEVFLCSWFIRKYFSEFFLKIDINICKEILKESWPFALTAGFGIIYHQVDTVMLSFMQGYKVVGWYDIAQKIPSTLLILPMILNGAVFPRMSYFFTSSKDSLKMLCLKYFKVMSILGILMGFGIFFFADIIILTFFGADYLPASKALKIIIWSTVLIFMNSAFLRFFESVNKQFLITKICGIALVINVVLNYLLIPKYSYIGSSIAIVSSELFITVTVIWFASRNFHKI